MKSVFILFVTIVAVQCQPSFQEKEASEFSLASTPRPQKYRTNLITKGQKSVNDFGFGGERVETTPEKVDDETTDYTLSPNCPRAFGLFAAKGSCRKYFHCRTGIAYEAECAQNTVFEVAAETCVHPDQSSRSECTAPEYHQFICPAYSSSVSRLRFGDHDRLAHPKDCSKFFACLLNGQPRVASCSVPLAFDESSGFCKKYNLVKGCEHFYDHLAVNDEDVAVVRQQVDEPVKILNPSKKNFFNFGRKF